VDADRFRPARKRAARLARWIAYGLVVAIFAGPYWGMVATAFSGPTVRPGTLVLWPLEPTVKHFVFAFRDVGVWRYLLNSSIVVAFGLVLQVTVSAFAAYALARKRFAGAAVVSLLILSTMMLPEEVIAIPLYLVLGKLPVIHVSMLNSYVGMIVPVAGWAFSIFVLTEFMKEIPVELEEAARIDGAGDLQIFFRIILPLSTPALGTIAIFGFIMIWDQYLLPLIVVNKETLYTLPVMLSHMRVDPTIPPNVFVVITVLAMLPSIVVYLALQRYFQRGLTAGAVKG
jgi:multiple sugar transport system permease protein